MNFGRRKWTQGNSLQGDSTGQVRDNGGFYWVVLRQEAEKQKFQRNIMELEWQDLLMDFMWGMREPRSPLQSGASSNTWNPFAPLASEIVMFQSNGARRTTNCPVEVKYTRGDWHILWIIIREIITVVIFSYRAILLLGEPLWACPHKSPILNLYKKSAFLHFALVARRHVK